MHRRSALPILVASCLMLLASVYCTTPTPTPATGAVPGPTSTQSPGDLETPSGTPEATPVSTLATTPSPSPAAAQPSPTPVPVQHTGPVPTTTSGETAGLVLTPSASQLTPTATVPVPTVGAVAPTSTPEAVPVPPTPAPGTTPAASPAPIPPTPTTLLEPTPPPSPKPTLTPTPTTPPPSGPAPDTPSPTEAPAGGALEIVWDPPGTMTGSVPALEPEDTLEFEVWLDLNENGNLVGVQLFLEFDPSLLEVLSITHVNTKLPIPGPTIIDNSAGTAKFATFTTAPLSAGQTPFEFARVTFKAKRESQGAPATVTIPFGRTKTAVSDTDGNDFLGGPSGARITVVPRP